MAKLVLMAIGILAVLVFSKRIRRIVFHIRVRRFFLTVLIVTFLAILGLALYLAYKYWWPKYMAIPTVIIYDETVEEDLTPVTPGTGGPAQPVIIQTR